MKYHIITFGCQMNESESEKIAAILENNNYQLSLEKDKADLILINMCSVRQSAVDRIHGKIRELAKLKIKNPKLKIILTGCVLKSDRKKFEKIFDFVLPNKEISSLPKLLSSFFNGRRKSIINGGRSNNNKKHSSLVAISTGCDNACSYCVVPFTRGRLICRSHLEVLKEIKSETKNGSKEIWLLGQNVNNYKSPANKFVNFANLLKKTSKIPGDFWIRFTSSHPKDFSKELIEVMAKSSKITPYLNLPVQSGDNQILKKMKRPYNISQYKNLVKKIRKKIPNISLSTDIIVGFPDETKKQFQNTVKLFQEMKFEMAYIAEYSPRHGTIASKLKDNVSRQEKKERRKILTEILKKNCFEANKNYVGKKLKVLAEKQKGGFITGKTKNYKTVKFQGSKNLIGKFVEVKIIEPLPWGLRGELV